MNPNNNLPLPDGNVVAWSNASTISQTLTGIGLLPNTTYTLSVYIGHRSDDLATTYSVSLQAGSTALNTISGSNSTIPLGQFAKVTLTYTTGSSVTPGDLSIQLTSGAPQVGFDAISLTTSGGIYYYVEDLLGSSRVMTTAAGAVCYDGDFDPFGGEHTYADTCPQNYKFEGKERDTETGNDDFGARYYTSRFGRWLSADWSSTPVAVPYANLTNPQTLNLYSMVADDPESFADLDGHDKGGSPCIPGVPACNSLGTALNPGECGYAAGGNGACRGSTLLDAEQQAQSAKQQAQGQSGAQRWEAQQQVTPEKMANALKQAGEMGDAGVKAAMAVVGTEAAIAGAVVAAPTVAATVNTATTSAYVQATTALSAAGTAIGNAASSLGNTVANAYARAGETVFRVGVQLDTIKPGGGALRAAGDFLTGLTPGARTPPNSKAGQLGKAIGAAYKLYNYLTR